VQLTRIEPHFYWKDYVVVQPLRRWLSARVIQENAMWPIARARELGEDGQVAIALHSAFQLTQQCFGRPLES
jgi:hypothetical protein